MQSPKRRRSTKTTKKRQTSKEDAFRLKAEPLLEALDSAIFQDNISKVEHEIKGTIRLSTAAGFASTHLVNLLDRFCEIYPGVRFETRVDSGLTALRS